jgi:hypothetical protein
MATTYTPIATQTLGSAAATVTFSSISGTYTDLILVYNGSYSAINGQISLRFNGDTATNYSSTGLDGNGTAASSGRDTSSAQMRIGYSATTGANMAILQIMNYSNATTYKTVIGRNNNPGGNVGANVGLWRSTAAITSIVVSCYNAVNFAAGSTFTLYGIKAA